MLRTISNVTAGLMLSAGVALANGGVDVPAELVRNNQITLCFVQMDKYAKTPSCIPGDPLTFIERLDIQNNTILASSACELARLSGTISVVPDRYVFALFTQVSPQGVFDDDPMFYLDCIDDADLAIKPFEAEKDATIQASPPTNEQVRRLQRFLTQLGYPVGGVDGIVGDKTVEASRKFYKDNPQYNRLQIRLSDSIIVLEITKDLADALNKRSPPRKTGGNGVATFGDSLRQTWDDARRMNQYLQKLADNCTFSCRIEDRAADLSQQLADRMATVVKNWNKLKRKFDGQSVQQQNPQRQTPPPVKVPERPACQKFSTTLERGVEETVLLVDKGILRFRRIPAPRDPEILIGLSLEQAKAIHKFETGNRSNAVLPFINRSVPQIFRTIDDFDLQTTLVDPQHFKDILEDQAADARKVSPKAAKEFIDRVNKICEGVAQVRLPSEVELEYAISFAIYPNGGLADPVNDAKSCRDVRRSSDSRAQGFHEIAGSYWQITSNTCRPYDQAKSPKISCEGVVVKGGASGDNDQFGSAIMSCMPQYRDVRSQDSALSLTSFRLVLED